MDIHLINQRLVDIYGKDLLDQPIYHVIWSKGLVEKRFEEFVDYVPGTNIFLRRAKEVRELERYGFLEPQWVLEKLFVNKHNDTILDNDTYAPRACTYEPIWCFGFEKNGRAKRPVWRAVELLIYWLQNPTKLTPSQVNDAEIKQMEEDEKIMLELMNTHMKTDALHSAVQDGDTVLYGRSTSEMPKNEP